ncbi:inhibitor of nuclear factor kappa-B kinase-interacting protein isoform X4 [Anolis carolinensis]|uniref:IKBKB interacting protein n=2 Tax=Anolis carolinensis TaxID=28377 RepID=A0A803TWF0_ANOCA|nr:PREDICTED: inhibitor of nuclear factor kappa-B kinase-interacting protein isoform X2 [Anolis carolinensis]XP_003221157.1 PREDICTED: inhibitor of nuclear factor kappa-B kinase-interacting protein isoform X2 [Anolis carolinensis]|eukprot:XP_003221156.1 PREDICTED: inhibitor of nuclear factor kappa-B kinase-interacting protein isoform X2 [Anolis carolinensis]
MLEVKRRKTANHSTKPNGDQREKQLGFVRQTSGWMDLQMVSSLLSLLMCTGLIWFLFQQSAQLAAVEEKYHLLKQETIRFQDMENKMNIMFEECEKTASSLEQVEGLHINAQMKHLQEKMNTMKMWSEKLIQEEEAHQQNITSLFHTVKKHEEATASATNEFSIKIATVKTDIRRISGLEGDVTLLVEDLHTLEDKVAKAEKTAIQSIGNLLTNSIDRTTELRKTATENARQIEHIKVKSSELNADLNKQSNRLLNLESDRAKVLSTVAFANDLKPKVFNFKQGLAHLEPMLDELTLRIGRLLEELLERKKELTFLNKKLSNLTLVSLN